MFGGPWRRPPSLRQPPPAAAALWLLAGTASTAAFSCSLGPLLPVGWDVSLALTCEYPHVCFEQALVKAAEGVRCDKIIVQARELLPAAAYLATPQTELRGDTWGPGFPVHDGHFSPAFLGHLPPRPPPGRSEDLSLALPGAEEKPVPEILAGRCGTCPIIKDSVVEITGLFFKLFGERVGSTNDNAKEGLGVLSQPNEMDVVTRTDRLLAVALARQYLELQGAFGVAVGDRDGWYATLAVAVGAHEKVGSNLFYQEKLGREVSWHLRTLVQAMPHRASFVILPPGVLGGAGLDVSEGTWNINGDAELLETVSQALATGGLVFALTAVGSDCLALRDPDKGRAERVYGYRHRERLLKDWELVSVHGAEPWATGPCRSVPQVWVLRYRWERHPASLLSSNRIDIIPKIIYAVHYWGIGRPDDSKVLASGSGAGRWAEELYFRTGRSMGSLDESHVLTNNIAASEPHLRKRGEEEFRRGFEFLLSSLKLVGFSRAFSKIWLDSAGKIIGGAHRVGASLVLGIERLPVFPTTLSSDIDQTFMLYNLDRLDTSTLLMEHARRLLDPRATRELYVAFVWPRAREQGHAKAVWEAFEKIEGAHVFLDVEVSLSYSACLHVVTQLHPGPGWAQYFANEKATGACGAADAAPSSGSAFVFELPKGKRSEARRVKAELREGSPLGSNTLFLTDSAEAVEGALAALLHPPTQAFFEAAPPLVQRDRLPLDLLARLPPGAQKHCVLDGAAVMQAHGLQPAGHVQLVCDEDVEVPGHSQLADHGKEPWLALHNTSWRADLVHDPGRFFMLDGWRLVAPEQIAVFRRARRRRRCGEPAASSAACPAAAEEDEDLREVAQLEALYGRTL